VDLRKVNKRVVDSLIKCGAFDSIGPSRAQLLAGLEEAMGWSQGMERERSNPQIILFGSTQAGKGRSEPALPVVPEWPESQRLTFEKETLGFYLTGHPLTRYADALRRLTTTHTQQLREISDGEEIVIGGVVNGLKEITTKKGDRMAFLTLEDLHGVAEVIIFAELYKKSALLLKSEEPVFIKGRVDAGDENAKIVANEILPFEQAVNKLTTTIHLRLRSEGLHREDLLAIREIFEDCRGPCPAYLHLLLPDRREAVIILGDEWKLTSSDQLVQRMRDLLGYEAVSFQA